MRREKDLKRYGKVMRENLSKHLKDNLTVSYDIYPSEGPGALLVFEISKEARKERYKPLSKTVSDAFSSIEQNFFSGDIKNMNFSGTNLFMAQGRIILIKGNDDQVAWSNRAALDDVMRIVTPGSQE